MSQMVIDMEHFLRRKSGKVNLYLSKEGFPREDFKVEFGTDRVGGIHALIRSVIKAVYDFIDLIDGSPTFGKAVGCRSDRKCAAVFETVETFFRCGSANDA